MTSSCHLSKKSTSFIHQKVVAPKNDDIQKLFLTLNESKKVEPNFIKRHYMHKEGQE